MGVGKGGGRSSGDKYVDRDKKTNQQPKSRKRASKHIKARGSLGKGKQLVALYETLTTDGHACTLSHPEKVTEMCALFKEGGHEPY